MNVIGPTAELPSFADDKDADAWLRSKSPFYDSMAREIDGRGGYTFRSWDRLRGNVVHTNGARYIELNPDLKDGERLSILIFEITNAFQDTKHIEIDQRARTGAINDAEVFALRHELIEYDGLRYHRDVLSELDNVIGGIPRDMLTWINPRLTTLDSYSLPLAHNYLESQNNSGHTDHYRKHFDQTSRETISNHYHHQQQWTSPWVGRQPIEPRVRGFATTTVGPFSGGDGFGVA